MASTSHWLKAVCALLASALLASCGGGSQGPNNPGPGSLSFVVEMRAQALSATLAPTALAAAGSSTVVTADMLLDWAEFKFAELFPKAAAQRLPGVLYEGASYSARAYRGSWGTRYLGITPDGRVFGLGDFSSNLLRSYETVAFWADQVLADMCRVYADLCAPVSALAAGQARVTGQLCSGAQQTGWCFQHPGEDINTVTDVFFLDAAQGWLVSEKGSLMQTQNGGQTWQPLPRLPIASPKTKVYFADQRVGWLLGGGEPNDGRLFRSGDGGLTWAPVPTPLQFVRTFLLVSPQLLVASGPWFVAPSTYAGERSAVSEDGGQSWRLTAEPVASAERHGVLWTASMLKRSIDGGRTFAEDPAFPPLRSVFSMNLAADGWGIRFQPQWDPVNLRSTATRVWARRGSDAAWVESVVPEALQPGQFFYASPLLNGPTGAWAALLTDPGVSTLWRSEDGLMSWQRVRLPKGEGPPPDPRLPPLEAAQFRPGSGYSLGLLDSNTAWVQTNSSEATGRGWYITTDGGRNWSTNLHPWLGQNNLVNEVRQDAGGLLMKVAEGSRWWRSANSGQTWTALPLAQPADGDESISQFVFVGADRGLALSDKDSLLSTDDGGQS